MRFILFSILSTVFLFTTSTYATPARDLLPEGQYFSFYMETNGTLSEVPLGEVRNQIYLTSFDESGEITVWHQWPNDLNHPQGSAGYLMDNGKALISGTQLADATLGPGGAGFPPGAHGELRILAADGRVLWAYNDLCEFDGEPTLPGSALSCLHHDLEPMPNGNILVSAYKKYFPDELAELGWDASQAVDSNAPYLWLDVVYELKPIYGRKALRRCDGAEYCTKIVWQWEVADHTGTGVGKIDLNAIDSTNPAIPALLRYDQTHINSISYNPLRDEILISSFGYNELWIIDHSVNKRQAKGPAGDLLYRWGNPNTYDCNGSTDAATCSRITLNQHDARWLYDEDIGNGRRIGHSLRNGGWRKANDYHNGPWAPGYQSWFNSQPRVLLHNNNTGPGLPLGNTQILELDLPTDGYGNYVLNSNEPYGPVAADVIYGPFVNAFASGVHFLPDGDLLVTLTAFKQVTRIDGDDDIAPDAPEKVLWSKLLPPGPPFFIGQVYKIPDSFEDTDRAIRKLRRQAGDLFYPRPHPEE